MDVARGPNADQATHWNGSAGNAWTEGQPLIDGLLAPIEKMLTDAVVALRPTHVLDVGCGTGSTTLAIARRLDPGGRCVGLDISEPMLATARARAEREGARARFLRADAQIHAFEPASFDMIASRFGVMFFNDPVEAFTNLRHATKERAQLRCIVWRSAAENPFMTTAAQAAAPLLPPSPPRAPDAPGQFAFADPERVRRILAESGWTDISLQPVDPICTMPEKDLIFYFTRFGPLGKIFHDLDAPTRDKVIETARPAFEPFVDGTEVRFTAACWLVSANASSC